MTTSISRHLGPPVDIKVKLRMPKAFLDYINEIVIKQKVADSIDEYCSQKVLTGMLTDDLDWDTEILLKDHVIPPLIMQYQKEIRETYLENRER